MALHRNRTNLPGAYDYSGRRTGGRIGNYLHSGNASIAILKSNRATGSTAAGKNILCPNRVSSMVVSQITLAFGTG